MALDDFALATLDEVKTYLGVSDDDRDDILETLIEDISRTILDETGREYAPKLPAADEDDPIDRVVAYRGGASFIDLSPYEAREVTAVTFRAGESDEVELAAGDWQLRPIATRTGVYDRIHLITGGYYQSGYFDRVPVTITGRWGWPAVPENVKGWLKEMVEDRFREDIAAYADASAEILDTSPIGTTPTTIPFRIQAAMNRARRSYIGAP